MTRTVRYWFIVMCSILFVSTSSYAQEGGLSKEKRMLGELASAYRLEAIKKKPDALFKSVLDEITAGAAMATSLDARQISALGELFISGSIPVALNESTIAYYNPYCDIALILEVDTNNDTKFVVTGSFIAGGDTVASLLGQQEKTLNPDELNFVAMSVPERVTSRVALLNKGLKSGSALDFFRALKPLEIHSRLFNRYLSLIVGMVALTPIELKAINQLINALNSGHFLELSKSDVVAFDGPLPFANQKTDILGSYVLDYALGDTSKKSYFISPIKNPALLIIVEASPEDTKVRVSNIKAINLFPSEH